MSRTWHHRLKSKYHISTWEQNVVTDIDYLNSFEYILVNILDRLNIIDKESLILKFKEFEYNDDYIKTYLKKHKTKFKTFNCDLSNNNLEYSYTYYMFINPKSIKQYNIDDKIYQMIVYNYEFRNELTYYINIVNNYLNRYKTGNIRYNVYSTNTKPLKQTNDRVNKNNPKLNKDEIFIEWDKCQSLINSETCYIDFNCEDYKEARIRVLIELLNVEYEEFKEVYGYLYENSKLQSNRWEEYKKQIAENYKEINYNVKSLKYDILCIHQYNYYGEYVKLDNSTIIKQSKVKYHSKLKYTLQEIQVSISKRKSYDIKYKRRLRRQELVNSKLRNTIEYQDEINIDNTNRIDIDIQKSSYKPSNIKISKNKSLSYNNILQLKNKIHNSPKVKQQVLQNRSDSKMYELFNYKYKKHTKEYYNIKTLDIQKQETLDEYIYQNNKILNKEHNKNKQ